MIVEDIPLRCIIACAWAIAAAVEACACSRVVVACEGAAGAFGWSRAATKPPTPAAAEIPMRIPGMAIINYLACDSATRLTVPLLTAPGLD